MNASIRVRYERPAPLAVATFVLALLTTLATACVAWWWAPIDAAVLTSADDAGWDTNLLLPHQHELFLAVVGAAALSLALTVVSFLAMRASRPPAQPPARPQQPLGPPSTVDTKV